MRDFNTPPWVFFTFFKLYKSYQIAQHTRYISLVPGSFTISIYHKIRYWFCWHLFPFLLSLSFQKSNLQFWVLLIKTWHIPLNSSIEVLYLKSVPNTILKYLKFKNTMTLLMISAFAGFVANNWYSRNCLKKHLQTNFNIIKR